MGTPAIEPSEARQQGTALTAGPDRRRRILLLLPRVRVLHVLLHRQEGNVHPVGSPVGRCAARGSALQQQAAHQPLPSRRRQLGRGQVGRRLLGALSRIVHHQDRLQLDCERRLK